MVVVPWVVVVAVILVVEASFIGAGVCFVVVFLVVVEAGCVGALVCFVVVFDTAGLMAFVALVVSSLFEVVVVLPHNSMLLIRNNRLKVHLAFTSSSGQTVKGT